MIPSPNEFVGDLANCFVILRFPTPPALIFGWGQFGSKNFILDDRGKNLLVEKLAFEKFFLKSSCCLTDG